MNHQLFGAPQFLCDNPEFFVHAHPLVEWTWRTCPPVEKMWKPCHLAAMKHGNRTHEDTWNSWNDPFFPPRAKWNDAASTLLSFHEFSTFFPVPKFENHIFFSWKEEISMTQITAMAHFWFSLPGSWAAGSLHNRWVMAMGTVGRQGLSRQWLMEPSFIFFHQKGGHQVREFRGGANFSYKQVDQNRFAQYFAAMCFYLCVCNEQLLG
jgi:hypothetical protein